MATKASGVHLVGSINLSTPSEVLKTVPTLLPNRLKRLPDGETGERGIFTRWQTELFKSHPQVIQQYNEQWFPIEPAPVTPSEIKQVVESLPELRTGYEDHAISSFAVFKELKEAGAIPAKTRFQVSLPNIVNVITQLSPPYQLPIEPLYEAALHKSLQRIQDAIPHDQLAIQLDIAIDVALLEGAGPWAPYFDPIFPGVVERAARLLSLVSEDVELGVHLCYGDLGHRHFVEPHDLKLLVDLFNALKKEIKRPFTWVHMPVPKYRDDADYFAPLKGLERGDTEMYLGVVHHGDEEGTWKRIKRAREVVSDFGVATECGLGRTPADQFEGIMEVLRNVSSEVV